MSSPSLESQIDALIARLNSGGRGGADVAGELCGVAVKAVALMQRRRLRSNGKVKLRRTELLLIASCGSLLRQGGNHHAARMMFGAAAKFAQGKDEYTHRFFLLQAVRSCVDLLDFDAARVVLREAGLCPPELSRSLEAARHYSATGASSKDLVYLRSAAVLALATYWSAAGPLGLADEAWALAAELSQGLAEPLCAAAEVELARAELRLDYGDLDGAERLLEASARRSLSSEQEAAWRVVRGMVFAARGRLSEADFELEAALAAVSNGSARGAAHERVAEGAAWGRLHVLAVLNRLDAADGTLTMLSDLLGGRSEDLELMRELVTARLSPGRQGLDLPPSVHETIKPLRAAGAGAAGDAPPRPGLEWSPREAQRRCTRLRQDWARVADRIQLSLHHSRLADAAAGLEVLTRWTAASDSPFLASRLDYLRSLVSYYNGDYATAVRFADAAAAEFAGRGMVLEQWSALRARTWAKRRSRASAAELQSAAEQEAALIDEICGRLKWSDRLTFRLNKWSAADERVAGWLRMYHEQHPPPRDTHGNGDGSGDTNRDIGCGGRERVRKRDAETLLQRVLQSWRQAPPAKAAPADAVPPAPAGTAPHRGSSLAADPFLLVSRRAAAGRGGSAGQDVPRSAWLGCKTALLYYVVLPDRVELFMLSRDGGTEVLRVDVPRPTLRRIVAAANIFLHRNETWEPSQSLEQCTEALMIRRLLGMLPGGVDRLLIVPSDAVISAPFAALPFTDQAVPLCTRYTVAMLPSFRWVSKGSWPLTTRLSPWRKGAAFGVSDAPGEQPLTAVAQEMDVLKRRLRWRVRVHEGPDATTAVSRRELQSARFVHFACHGNFDVNDPLGSGLAMTDGRLSVEQISGMSLRQLRRVVAASCWSGDSTVLPGREVLGLSSAFLDAGVAEVITSLWQVFDAASPKFMDSLYARFDEESAESALARTQAEAWEKGHPPREWAGYGISLRGETPGPALARLRIWLSGR